MRVVIDTNIWVSYLFWGRPPVQTVVDRLLQTATVLRSTDTFAELAEVLVRRKFDPYMVLTKREMFLATYRDKTQHVSITRRINACRDPKDNKFLELAVCGQADMILSGDDDLLALHPFQGIRIIDPKAFYTNRS